MISVKQPSLASKSTSNSYRIEATRLSAICSDLSLVKVSRCARIVRAMKLAFLTAGKSFQRRVMAGSNKRRQPFFGYNCDLDAF
jgi:hypothetical protein